MEEIISEIFKLSEKYEKEALDDLIALCKIPSIAKKGGDGYIYGKEVNDALELSKDLFKKVDIPLFVKEGGYAYGSSKGGDFEIGLFSHADVVPVNEKDWKITSPFSPKISGNYIYGRGVYDDKAGIITALYALKVLKDLGKFPKAKVSVFVGGSEENGMEDLDNFVKTEKMPDVSLVLDGSFPVSCAEKGILRIDVISNEAFTDIKNFVGGNAYNVVLDSVDVNVHGEVKTFKGISAHAAHPEGSENAVFKASEFILNNDSICENDKKIVNAMKKSITGYYGEGLGIESDGSLGKLTSSNGIVKVIDNKLLFTLDIRYGTEVCGADVFNKVKEKMAKLGFTATANEIDDGYENDVNGKEIKVIMKAFETVSGKENLEPIKMCGATYARHLKNAYALLNSTPFDMAELNLPNGCGNVHQSDETLNIKAFIDGIKICAISIMKLDEMYSK